MSGDVSDKIAAPNGAATRAPWPAGAPGTRRSG